MEIAHITFEKITGLKGTFEGVFVCDQKLDETLPLVFKAWIQQSNKFVFSQDEQLVYLRPLDLKDTLNFMEQFYYGVNFLIKQVTYDGAVKTDRENPN